MKGFRILFLLIGIISLLGINTNMGAQTVTVDLDNLPPEVKEQVNAQIIDDAVTKKFETYGKWAGMGKEIGIATREGLSAVKDVTLEVAETDLGKTVIWLIIWKVAGIDFIRILIGLMILIFVTIIVAKSYFQSFSTRQIVEKSGFFLWKTKKYEIVDPERNWGNSSSNRAAAQFFHAVIWLGTVGIAFAIAFA